MYNYIRESMMRERLECNMTFLLSRDENNTFSQTGLGLAKDGDAFFKILESICDVIYVLDFNWKFVYLNSEAERYFFVSREKVIGKSIWDIFPQAVNTILYEYLHIAKKNGEKLKFEAPSFSELDEWHAYTIFPSGDYISIIVNDITRSKEKERLSDEVFMRVFNAGLSMMAIKSLNGRIIDANRSWLTNTGYTKEEVIGKLEEEIDLWANLQTREMINRILQDGAVYNLEVKYKTKDGSYRIGILSMEEIEVGSVKYYLEAITDVTKQKELEEEMAKLDRLNIIGQMAAGISHEFRNPITTVRGFIQMLSGRKELANIKDYFDIMIEEIDRANSIVSEFLTLSKNKPLDLKKDNINKSINKLFPMIQAGAFNEDKDIALELNDVPDICMDESEIRQLILNLSRNAIEASPIGGVITLSTYREGEEVVLAIKDQGDGIDSETLSQLGTPFFTTKVNGTGMGLVICYRIAERHHAKIIIDTGPKGTNVLVKFKVLLPGG